MRILTLFHLKGGVGKTSCAVNLAYLAAREGGRVLFWDMDPQSSATFYFRVRPKLEGGARGLVEGEHGLEHAIRGSDYEGLDVVPGAPASRKLEDALADHGDPETRLRELLAAVEDDYDWLVLDCAPTLAGVTETVFSITDALLCPTIPTTLSLRTLAGLMKHLKKRKGPRPLVVPFFCMVDRRKALHREVVDWVRGQGLGFLESAIPNSSLVEQMGLRRRAVPDFAPRSEPARAFEHLWSEVRDRVERRPERNGLYRKSTRRALEEIARMRPGRRL